MMTRGSNPVCTHLTRSSVDRVWEFTNPPYDEYGLDVPSSVLKVWEMDARPSDNAEQWLT